MNFIKKLVEDFKANKVLFIVKMCLYLMFVIPIVILLFLNFKVSNIILLSITGISIVSLIIIKNLKK